MRTTLFLRLLREPVVFKKFDVRVGALLRKQVIDASDQCGNHWRGFRARAGIANKAASSCLCRSASCSTIAPQIKARLVSIKRQSSSIAGNPHLKSARDPKIQSDDAQHAVQRFPVLCWDAFKMQKN